MPRALDALEGELNGGQHAVQAALAMLRMAGLDKLNAPGGDTDAEAIIDDLAGQRMTGNERLPFTMNDRTASHAQRQAVLADLDAHLSGVGPVETGG